MITKEKKVFFLYTILIAILVIVGFSLLYLFKSSENYYLVVRVYIVIEYSLLAYFFSLFIRNLAIKRILLFTPVAFLIFCVYDFIIEKTPGLPFLPASVAHILLLCFIIYYFFEVMQDSVVEPIYQRAIFWISVAFIINSSGNFFLFLYSRTSFNDDTFKSQYTIIYTTVTVIKNLLLCISIMIKENKPVETLHHPIDIDLDSFNPIKSKP